VTIGEHEPREGTTNDALEGKMALIPLIPLGRMATPDEVAQCVAFLVSDGARYLTGEVLTIDGGMMAGFNFLMPPPAEHEG
jgi:NAD(P)-dependent dehydrogenase (short-subunit alcohol dehydrogenase family)